MLKGLRSGTTVHKHILGFAAFLFLLLFTSFGQAPVPVIPVPPTESGLASDSAGNLYLAVSVNSVVRKVTPSGVNSVVAGTGSAGFSGDGGPASEASLRNPSGIAVDSEGNLYIADAGNLRVRKVSRSGLISTVAGTGASGDTGDGGSATAARFLDPQSIAVDQNGNIYVSDKGAKRVRKVSANGTITAFAGTGKSGCEGEGGRATPPGMNSPIGLAADGAGNVYIAVDRRICRVRPDGTIETIARGNAVGRPGDAPSATGAFAGSIASIAADKGGNVYFADLFNSRIGEVTSSGQVLTVAGTGERGIPTEGGFALTEKLVFPDQLAVSGSGDLFFNAPGSTVWKISTDGRIRTFFANSTGVPLSVVLSALSRLPNPPTLTIGGRGSSRGASSASSSPMTIGNPVPADPSVLTRPGYVAPYALKVPQPEVTSALLDNSIRGNLQLQFTIDERGRPTDIVVTHSLDCELDKIAIQTLRSWRYEPARVGGRPEKLPYLTEISVRARPVGSSPRVNAAPIRNPLGVTVDGFGNVYVANSGNSSIRKVTANGVGSIVAGGEAGFGGDGNSVAAAKVRNPSDVSVDAADNLYILDAGNGRVRKVTAEGIIVTVAGRGIPGFSGDDGNAMCAEMRSPRGIAIGPNGLLIADTGNNRIRRVKADGTIGTIAGTGAAGFSGDGGPARLAQLKEPAGIFADSVGNLYIADTGNNRIRAVAPEGTIKTIAGTGASGFSGDGGPAAASQLKKPTSIAADISGNLYIADTGNHRIRKVSVTGVISTVAGNGIAGFSGDGGRAASAQLKSPSDIAMDSSGNLYIADTGNNAVRKVSPSGVIVTLIGSPPAGGR